MNQPRGLCLSTPTRYMRALDTLEHAAAYLETQYSPRLSRADAIDHFQSRSMLLRHRFHLYNEIVRRFPEMQGVPLTQAEIDAAVQQAKEHRSAQGAA